ncbi:MmcQ/YjbR family DNA-binding protein [Arthrobacter sp. A5]|uniref:MmcQ/YjbR family DNA-binding protein n=1 Tax=Arthrobacter sp. A5 TaxID=576926 RepID=UPI003DAA1AC4
MANEEDVRRICFSLPGVCERPSWGQPAWFARTLMARMWEEGVLTVKSQERDALAGIAPDIYFWTPHHQRSPILVLIHLDKIASEELQEPLEESYRIAGAPQR